MRRAVAVATLLLAAGFAVSARSQNATWAGDGADWNTNANWSPAPAPSGTVIFPNVATTLLTFSQLNTSIGTIQFNAGAPGYAFTIVEPCDGPCNPQTLNVDGLGIVDDSANAPIFSLGMGGILNFQNASTAANAIIVTTHRPRG